MDCFTRVAGPPIAPPAFLTSSLVDPAKLAGNHGVGAELTERFFWDPL